MEMARKCARRFNNIYGVEFFPEPQNFYFGDHAIKIPGLDGSGKMGKSEGNCIYLYEDAKSIEKKVKKAVTDSGPTEPNQEKPEVIQNLFTLMEIASSKETYDYFNEKWNDMSIREQSGTPRQGGEDGCRESTRECGCHPEGSTQDHRLQGILIIYIYRMSGQTHTSLSALFLFPVPFIHRQDKASTAPHPLS